LQNIKPAGFTQGCSTQVSFEKAALEVDFPSADKLSAKKWHMARG